MMDFAERFRNFQFFNPGELIDGALKLVVSEYTPADPTKNYVPAYAFELRLSSSDEKIGNLHFRAATTPSLEKYGGHVGYNVNPEHRGHRYAERACRLIIPLMRQHGFTEIWITCNPDNHPSRRTCERLGAELIEIVDLPSDHEMYKSGDRRKCRYRLSVI